MRVLIVEDDRALGLFLQKGLKLEGHETHWVEDGETAIEQLRTLQPDLMVLDLNLPRRDGMEVLQEARSFAPNTAVLVLTGRGGVEERVRCLDQGADDCLLKPFSFHELTARCRAILRRFQNATPACLRFGAIEMDLLSRKVTRGGRPVELTSKEFALLECLMRRKGACSSREELLRNVWQMSTESHTNVVDVYINYLRKKLAQALPEGERESSPIRTVRGSGYCVEVATSSCCAPESHPALARRAS